MRGRCLGDVTLRGWLAAVVGCRIFDLIAVAPKAALLFTATWVQGACCCAEGAGRPADGGAARGGGPGVQGLMQLWLTETSDM